MNPIDQAVTAVAPRSTVNLATEREAILARLGRPQPTTDAYASEFVDAVQLGEESGRLAETLDKHFQFLQLKVRFALTTLTQLASTLVWVVVSALLIFIIFRIFGRYLALGPGAVDAAVEKVLESRQAQ